MATGTRIGTTIRQARDRKHWTQQQLADAVGVSRTTVDAWENDRGLPRNKTVVEDVLGITLPDVMIPPRLQRIIEGLTPEEQEWVIERLTRPRGDDAGQAPV